jgi:hypothetical protein
MSKFTEKLREEFLALLPPTLFFLVALHIVALVRTLMTKGEGLPVSSSAQIALGALIIGKAVLLADLWPAINRFPHKPLIWNILWKTLVYFAVATFIHYLERLFDFSREGGGIAAGHRKMLAEIIWPHFAAIQLVLVLLIFNYCVIRELARALGEAWLMRLIFVGRPQHAPAVGGRAEG